MRKQQLFAVAIMLQASSLLTDVAASAKSTRITSASTISHQHSSALYDLTIKLGGIPSSPAAPQESKPTRSSINQLAKIELASQKRPPNPEELSLSGRLRTIENLIQELRLVEAKQIVEQSLEDQLSESPKKRGRLPLLLLYKGLINKLLGNTLVAKKAYQEAARQLHESKTIDSEIEGFALNALAALYLEAKEYEKAKTLMSKGLKIGTPRNKHMTAVAGVSLSNLGMLSFKTGHYSDARRQLSQAIRILRHEKAQRGFLLLAINNLYMLNIAENRVLEAEQLLSAILQESQSPDPSIAHELSTLYYNAAAFYYYLRKDNAKTLKFTRLGLGAQRTFLMAQLPKLATNNRSQFLDSINKRGEAAEWLYWWSAYFDGASKLALETSINNKGLLQELDRAQSGLMTNNSELGGLAKEINELIIRYSSSKALPETRKALLRRIENKQEHLYTLAPTVVIKEASIDDISRNLPFDGSLIETRKYRRFLGDFNATGDQWGEAFYLAWIVKPNGTIITVQLGPAAPIESAIDLALKANSENTKDAQQRWAQVSDLLLKPLMPALQGSNQWFLTPDAELNRVPFAALPAPQDPSKPLAQAIQLRLLTTGRDLLRLQQIAKQGQVPAVMANPNFDRMGSTTTALAIVTDAKRRQTRSAERKAETWAALPGSEREGQEIGKLLDTIPITGNEATASRLQQLKAPRVLHIASHGFFVGDVVRNPDDTHLQLQDHAPILRAFQGKDPQLRSGLVLAGANNLDAGPYDDGYLTAAEAVTLQLDGTELVVLSACDTAKGETRTGEGVYGLQRSLTVAGARSTLLSLWKVDDAATAEFMTRFYTRLKAGEGRSDALAATQKEFREGLAGNGHWKDPYYWAAWQLVGDWRPIKGL